jgi:DNA primase
MSRVDLIRKHHPIAAFVAPYTHGLKRSGAGWYIGRCPFHQSPADRPNKRKFWVNVEKGICGCFVPGCEASGQPMDVINFYARLKKLTNREAIYQLWETVPQSVKSDQGVTGQPH